MERISSDIDALIREVIIEIDNFELNSDEKIIAFLSEIPSIRGFHYKIVLTKTTDGTVRSRFRQWDTAYNISNWTTGIYNLDRLRIVNYENFLSVTEIKSLYEYLSTLEKMNLPETLNKEKALILDGSEWKFGICFSDRNVVYNWKAPTEDIVLFEPIIELIRNKYIDVLG